MQHKNGCIYRFGLIVLPLRLVTGSSVAAFGVIDSIGCTFSTDDFRGMTLCAATFGVEGVVFGVTTFALRSDFILAEPLGFNTFEMSL